MKQFLFKFLHGIFFIVCMDLIGTSLWTWAVLRAFENNVPKAPIAAVLINEFDKDTGELDPETQRRLNHALDLYRRGTVDYLLCVGGARPRFKVFGSELMRQFLIGKGVPEGEIFLERKSFDSRTNWQMAYKAVRDHGWDKFVVVSSPFHLQRFRQVIINDPKSDIRVLLSPYILNEAQPPITCFGVWRQVHYEWLAHFSQMLPEKMYNKWIYQIRGQ